MKQHELLREMANGFNSSINPRKDPLGIVLKRERNNELLHRLKSLSASELVLVHALFYEEISEADYALRNNMSEDEVKSEKKRIFAKLRESFSGERWSKK
jgi:DNA-directed RNA polymerase specialized sigma24 family protein